MDDTVRFVWGEYRVWATTSRVLKDRTTRVGTLVFLLVIVGTASGTFTPLVKADSPLSKVLPFIAAVVLGLATYLTNQLLNDSERQSWIKARALAEALKSESFKYLTKAPPYQGDDAAQALIDKAIELQKTAQGVLPEVLTDEQRAKGLPSGPLTIPDYVKQRVREQIDTFYRPGIKRHRTAMNRARTVTLIAGVIAVVLSAGASTFGNWIGPVLGIVTTIAASFAAWFQSGQHQQIAQNYQDAMTKTELTLVRYNAAGAANPQLVVDVEAVFQAEHAAWLAGWQESKPIPIPASGQALPDAVKPKAPV